MKNFLLITALLFSGSVLANDCADYDKACFYDSEGFLVSASNDGGNSFKYCSEGVAKLAPKAPPNPENYDDIDKFNADNADYYKTVGRQEERKTIKSERQQSTEDKAYNSRMEKWQLRRDDAVEEDPTYLADESKVVRVMQAYKNNAAFDVITSRKDGTKIMKYLSQHPEEMELIASSSPMETVAELGAISGRLSARMPKKKTAITTTPIKPGGMGGGAPAKSASEQAQAEYNAAENKKEFGF